MLQAFAEGGPFMFVILLVGLGLTVLTIIQFALHKKTDLAPLLWGLLAALVGLGILATLLGMGQGFDALAYAAPEMRAQMIARMVSIAISTTTLSMIFAVPLAIAIGVASFLIKRAWRRRQAG